MNDSENYKECKSQWFTEKSFACFSDSSDDDLSEEESSSNNDIDKCQEVPENDTKSYMVVNYSKKFDVL